MQSKRAVGRCGWILLALVMGGCGQQAAMTRWSRVHYTSNMVGVEAVSLRPESPRADGNRPPAARLAHDEPDILGRETPDRAEVERRGSPPGLRTGTSNTGNAESTGVETEPARATTAPSRSDSGSAGLQERADLPPSGIRQPGLAEVRWGSMRTVTVRTGDTLGHIARRHGTHWRAIARINGLANPHRIRVGQTLRIPDGNYRAEIDLAGFQLTVYAGEKRIQSYPIGIGADETRTPRGSFTVHSKAANPPWHYKGQYAAPGAPDNPIGSRWLAFGDGYGIHGTNEPGSIGRRGSLGCIRLRNEHVEELFDLLAIGSKVEVR